MNSDDVKKNLFMLLFFRLFKEFLLFFSVIVTVRRVNDGVRDGSEKLFKDNNHSTMVFKEKYSS